MFKQMKSALFWYYLYKFRKRAIFIFFLLLVALFSGFIYGDVVEYLKLTQNIFNGFSTTEKINYQEARVFGAAYHYLENANDVAFNMTQAYIDLLRSYQLLQNAKDNVVINKKI